MITLFSLLLFIIFTILGGFHFYWLFGGMWGLKKVIPTKDNTQIVVSIPKFATLIVALGLIGIGILYFLNTGFLIEPTKNKILEYMYWTIPSIFILRAIGEFNYVGFFKKIKNTEFAQADTKLFSPLCFCIGIIGIAIQLLK